MEKYLVKLNRPLLVKTDEDEPIYYNIYGILTDRMKDKEQNKELKHNLRRYIGYLAAMHEWTDGADDFSVVYDEEDIPQWQDKNGVVHKKYDDWSASLGTNAMKKLGLGYEIYALDLEDDSDWAFDIGLTSDLLNENITSAATMDKLVELAESREDK